MEEEQDNKNDAVPRARLNYFSNDDVIKHLTVKEGGYTIDEIIEEYRTVNEGFLNVMDKLHKMSYDRKVTPADIDYLKSQEFYYHKRKLTRRDTLLMPQGVFKNILQGTLTQTVDKAKDFFGEPEGQRWKKSADSYKAGFISWGGVYYTTLIFMVDKLYNYLTDLFNDYCAEDDQFGEYYSFPDVMEAAECFDDLRERKQFLKDIIIECKSYCLREDLGDVYEAKEKYFLNKCSKAIEIIDLQLQNELETSRVEIAPKAKPAQISAIHIASKKKTDIIKILSAMYDAKMFADAEGNPLTNKQKMMEAFGVFLGEEFSTYSASLSQAKKTSEKLFLNPFKEIEKEALRYFNEVKG